MGKSQIEEDAMRNELHWPRAPAELHTYDEAGHLSLSLSLSLKQRPTKSRSAAASSAPNTFTTLPLLISCRFTSLSTVSHAVNVLHLENSLCVFETAVSDILVTPRGETHTVQPKIYLASAVILCCSPAASSKRTRPAQLFYCKSHQ